MIRVFGVLIAGLFFFGKCASTDNVLPDNPIARTAIQLSGTVNWPYDAAYYSIPYPNGDVPGGGACTDVVIRVLRKHGIDLQKEVHDDMLGHFASYPQRWGSQGPDANIDHRRVPNLMTWFSRRGYDVGVSTRIEDYRPGDIVCWELSPGITHIGVHTGNGTIFHNIGPRAKLEPDVLFRYRIIGHYRIGL